MEDVVAVYGGTTWIQHTGYVLRGASSGVVANSATKTGGSDDAIVPYHTHSMNGHTHGMGHRHSFSIEGLGDGPAGSGWEWLGKGSSKTVYTNNAITTGGTSARTSTDGNSDNVAYAGTSGNTTNANIPNYKSVYIWERTA